MYVVVQWYHLLLLSVCVVDCNDEVKNNVDNPGEDNDDHCEHCHYHHCHHYSHAETIHCQ